METLSPPSGSENIFSISDLMLTERLQFQKEVSLKLFHKYRPEIRSDWIWKLGERLALYASKIR